LLLDLSEESKNTGTPVPGISGFCARARTGQQLDQRIKSGIGELLEMRPQHLTQHVL
jgi:hypothetical protein